MKIEQFKTNQLSYNDSSFEIIEENLKDYEILIENEKIIGRNKIGTEAYMPLESLLRMDKQGFSVDVWSVGVILLQIVTKKYSLFHNVTFAKPLSTKPKKYNRIVSFILELSLLFGTDAIISLLNEFG